MGETEMKTKPSTESGLPKVNPESWSLAQHAAFATDTMADPFMGYAPPRTSNRIKNYRCIQNWENYFLSSGICSVAMAMGADEEVLKTIGRE